MDSATHPLTLGGPGWPARPSPPAPAEGPGGQLRLDVLEQTGRCRRCRRNRATLGPYCDRCCYVAEAAGSLAEGGQAASAGDYDAAAPPQGTDT